MDRILDAGFKQPAAESVLIQSNSARVGDPAFTAAIADVVARVSAAGDGPERPLAARSRQRRPDRAGRPRRRSSSSTSAAIRTRPSTRSGRSSTASPPRSAPILASSSASSAKRARRRSRDGVHGRPREGGDALAPDHADHPRAHVRRARGGRHSAAARADRRVRDVRAGGAGQPRCCRWRTRRPRSCS